ncbi:ExbD/TolR family protein [Phaeocystidibacter luteus]|uniref:Biopolymer transporter ExbD n=1 Tax=Phaeocystidibacter luteus TaxID=911197 RepID=A0A6N6RIK7_9FLAO|nr:biopolymer transporter ExbD [Phaeocystidibacter luteus]KAB2810254.1 biopolymer transporter ExbD [Phaeocystidibacter luteus]
MNFNRKSKVSADFAMSSMTDLVFLLLIFFMLTSTLVTSRALDLILPKSNAQTVKRNDVSVSITADLQYSVNGTNVSQAQLENELLTAVVGNPEAVVVLYADESVPTGKTVEVMDIAYRNKLKMILATDPK